MPDCEKCPQAEMTHEIALGRMYATNELVKLVKQIDSGQLVEVVRCRECKYFDIYKYSGNGYCTNNNGYGFPNQKPDDFCSRGERKRQ